MTHVQVFYVSVNQTYSESPDEENDFVPSRDVLQCPLHGVLLIALNVAGERERVRQRVRVGGWRKESLLAVEAGAL